MYLKDFRKFLWLLAIFEPIITCPHRLTDYCRTPLSQMSHKVHSKFIYVKRNVMLVKCVSWIIAPPKNNEVKKHLEEVIWGHFEIFSKTNALYCRRNITCLWINRTTIFLCIFTHTASLWSNNPFDCTLTMFRLIF